MSQIPTVIPRADYALHFESLVVAGRSCAFPCDAAGRVDLDALSDKARANYLYARTVVGREYSIPAVLVNSAHRQTSSCGQASLPTPKFGDTALHPSAG